MIQRTFFVVIRKAKSNQKKKNKTIQFSPRFINCMFSGTQKRKTSQKQLQK